MGTISAAYLPMVVVGAWDGEVEPGGNGLTASNETSAELVAQAGQTLEDYVEALISNADCAGEIDCTATINCQDGSSSDPWVLALQYLPSIAANACDAAAPDLAGEAARAFQEIPLPASTLVVQPPGGVTLVNLQTNFYTEPAGFTTSVTLLGSVIELNIWPSSYSWSFGDGTSLTTASPGSPYPDLTVTHAYTHDGVYSASVTIFWSAEFRVAGGAWQPVDGTVAMPSAPLTLTVREATPVLTG